MNHDRRLVEDIIKELREAGWASPDDVRAIVAAAGGCVEISDRIWVDPPRTLSRVDHPERGITVFATAP